MFHFLTRLWRPRSLRLQILGGFAAVFIGLGISSALVHERLQEAVLSTEAADESLAATGLRQCLLTAVVDAETGKRGYLITGDPEFLEPYREARQAFARVLADLRESEAHEPEELEEFDEIEALFERWVTTVSEPLIALRESEPAGLFLSSFEAVYYLRQLRDVLRSATPAANESELQSALAEAVRHLRMAAELGARGAQRDQWLHVAEVTPELRGMRELLADGEGRRAALRRLESLLADLRELTFAARRAEDAIMERVAAGYGKSVVDRIKQAITTSIRKEEAEHAELLARSRDATLRAERLAIGLPVAAAGLGLFALFLIQLDAVRAIHHLRDAARRLASGDLGARLAVRRRDELGELAENFNEMADAFQTQHTTVRQLSELQSALVLAASAEEAFGIVARFGAATLRPYRGMLYEVSDSGNVVRPVRGWGEKGASARVFDPEACWALRTGRPHLVTPQSPTMPCSHGSDTADASTLCIPLATGGELLGLMYLVRDTGAMEIPTRDQELAIDVAETFTLALTSLRLAERLRWESIRDPLTGLYNRRYLEATFERELARAARAGSSLTLAVIDVDHFKAFNDRFGHAAGDEVLVEIASTMARHLRSTDIACRYGGEEFLMVLPDAGPVLAATRMEELRQRVASLELQHDGKAFGGVTVSIGIASYPTHGTQLRALLDRADGALYIAKREGRNRLVIAS